MIRIRLLTAILLILPACAYAGQDIITWVPPTLCEDNSPITACPITGYRIEVAATASATTWTPVTTAPASVVTATITGTSSGTRCYRMFVQSAGGDSLPSNAACKTQAPLPKALTITVQ